ncbi:MAG: hypothetical protein ACQEP8_03975 [Chlamydiota bacterium]
MNFNLAVSLTHDHHSVKIAEVACGDSGIKIRHLQEFSANDFPDNVNLLYKAYQSTSCSQSPDPYLVTALPSSEVLLKQIEIKLTKDSDIQAALPYHAEPLLPFSIDQAYIDSLTISKGERKTYLALSATTHESLQAHLQDFQLNHIEPEIVTTESQALACFAEEYASTEDFTFLLHVASHHSTIVLVQNSIALKARFINLGSVHLELSENSYDSPSYSDQFQREISKALMSLSANLSHKKDIPLLLTGDLMLFPEALSQIKQQYASTDDLSSHPCEHIRYALEIGMALMALPPYQAQGINLRQKDLSFPYPWKRFKKPAARFIILSLLLSLALYSLGELHYQHKLNSIQQDYALLQSKLLPSDQPLPTAKLCAEDINRELFNIETKIHDTPDTYLLLPDVPRVSDVIAWLSTLPTVIPPSDQGLARSPIIDIQALHYTLVKYPSPSKKKERYQAKVELKFTTPSTREAREFHETLLHPNAFVDPKNDVKWQVNRGLYSASFFLKNKPTYPIARHE